MANWKERYKRLKGHSSRVTSGAKGTAVVAAGGAAGALLAQVVAPYVADKVPYASGVVLALAGHFGKRKYPQIGQGVLGAAGAMICMEFLQKNPNIAAKLPGKAGSSGQMTSGYGDAGALMQGGASGFDFGDAGALYNAGAFEEGYG